MLTCSCSLRCLPWHHRTDNVEVMERLRVRVCQSVKWLTDATSRSMLGGGGYGSRCSTRGLHLRSVVWSWSESCSEFMIMGTLSICTDVIHSMSCLLSTPGSAQNSCTTEVLSSPSHRKGEKRKGVLLFSKIKTMCLCFLFLINNRRGRNLQGNKHLYVCLMPM